MQGRMTSTSKWRPFKIRTSETRPPIRATRWTKHDKTTSEREISAASGGEYAKMVGVWGFALDARPMKAQTNHMIPILKLKSNPHINEVNQIMNQPSPKSPQIYELSPNGISLWQPGSTTPPSTGVRDAKSIGYWPGSSHSGAWYSVASQPALNDARLQRSSTQFIGSIPTYHMLVGFQIPSIIFLWLSYGTAWLAVTCYIYMYISTMAITKNIGEEELLQEPLVLSKHQTKGLSFKPVFFNCQLI